MMWAAWTILAVMVSSADDGETSQLGWLWHRIMAAALARMAGLSTSRGWTWANETAPIETTFRPITSFLLDDRDGPDDLLRAF